MTMVCTALARCGVKPMHEDAKRLAAKYNAKRAAEGKTGMKWIVDDGGNLRPVSTARNEAPVDKKQDDLPL